MKETWRARLKPLKSNAKFGPISTSSSSASTPMLEGASEDDSALFG
jgi:hypothetical protein